MRALTYRIKQIFLKLLFFWYALCFFNGRCQLNCSNYYSQSNLPSQCSNENNTCSFPPFTNTSLIQNSTSIGQYSLCLDLPQYNIQVLEGKDDALISIYINSNNTFLVSGYILQTHGDFIVQAVNTILLTNVSIQASFVWFQSSKVQLQNSTVYNDESFGTDCDCSSKGTICEPPEYYFPYLYSSFRYPSSFNYDYFNYTFSNWIYLGQKVNSFVIAANTAILMNNSTLKISVIAIYTPDLIISNTELNNSGLGYSSGTGLGCGYFDQSLNQLLGCTGTGASHGGYGGNSGPQNCNLLMSRPPYDRDLIPKYPGSGGGFFLKELSEISSGGGVMNIQVNNLYIYNSNLTANGVNGIQGGGGGSGGSISIDFLNLNTSGSVNLSVSGGNAKSSGGGGRLRYFYHNWTYIGGNSLNLNVLIQASGGAGCEGKLTCGQNGSIIAAPCPPGYQFNLSNFGCSQCPTGTFQVAFGYDQCSNCATKPANSYYTGTSNPLSWSNYTQVCNFSCNNGSDGTTVYQLYNGQQCLDSFNYMLAGVGGINLLICIGIIVITIVVFLIILMVRKLSLTDKSLFEQNQNIDIYKKQSYFKIQDIPFHEIRIYFQGTNAPNNPWRVHQDVQNKLCQLEQYNSSMPFFSRLINQINAIGKYSRPICWLLSALTILYYPLGLFLASVFRQNKAKKMRNLLVFKSRQKKQDNMGIKLHVNPQYTVGSIEIFNFKKQTLDFYIKNYFPIYFKLQKQQSGGYAIDFTDPIFKALCFEYQLKNDKNLKLQDYLVELNQLLRNCDQTLSIFKHLWKINCAWPSLQCHLWQPDNIILGIDDQLEINKKIDLFLAFCTQSRTENSLSQNINLTMPLSSYSSQEGGRLGESKYSKHFLYKSQLPNIFFDEITTIRHKYHLRQAKHELQEKKTVFWQIQNSFEEKTLSWILGTATIIQLLLQLFSFFLVIFMLVEGQSLLLSAFVPYFVVFPCCQFFMIFLSFSLLISKRARIFVFALYFTIFSLLKYMVLSLVIMIISISSGFENNVLIITFFTWLMILIFNIIALVLLCMLHVHYGKVK